MSVKVCSINPSASDVVLSCSHDIRPGGRRQMPLGRQAKILTEVQQREALAAVAAHRYPGRDRIMLLLSFKAGLRAKEIAHLPWAMVTDSTGEVGDMIALQDLATKGRSGREIPMADAL